MCDKYICYKNFLHYLTKPQPYMTYGGKKKASFTFSVLSVKLPYQITDVCTDQYGLIVTRYSQCASDFMNIWSRKESVLRTAINKRPQKSHIIAGISQPHKVHTEEEGRKGKQLEGPSIQTLLDFLDQNLSAQESEGTFSHVMHCDQSFQPKSCR